MNSCIFSGSIRYENNDLPKEVYSSALRVIKTGITEIIKDNKGFYILERSENGPFSDYPFGKPDEWLKLRVYRIENWKSGGIKAKELNEFFSGKSDNG